MKHTTVQSRDVAETYRSYLSSEARKCALEAQGGVETPTQFIQRGALREAWENIERLYLDQFTG